jgi:hypothetical protein
MFLLTLGMAYTGTMYSDLAAWFQRYWEGTQREMRMKDLFSFLDQDGDGYLSVHEIQEALTSYLQLDPADIEAVMANLDQDKDGKVSIEEFTSIARQTGRVSLATPSLRGTPAAVPCGAHPQSV